MGPGVSSRPTRSQANILSHPGCEVTSEDDLTSRDSDAGLPGGGGNLSPWRRKTQRVLSPWAWSRGLGKRPFSQQTPFPSPSAAPPRCSRAPATRQAEKSTLPRNPARQQPGKARLHISRLQLFTHIRVETHCLRVLSSKSRLYLRIPNTQQEVSTKSNVLPASPP
ncbi:hypothetical protein HJG60_008949 [Phyllostomus discolor]|uniref:Uncharacterized protein n=1 Tax=Phyllostomus discolor TaxID=89673 RepID=A0A833YWK4_9CHIR|nr:hypothetical protein HJG60_008949 [Phyllostomus discolor]